MKLLVIFAALYLVVNGNVFAQDDDDLIFGKTPKLNSAALFDLSDPNGVNMEVNMWGFVRYPGKYRVPVKTTFVDVMSYAGGPLENSNLEDIRILRTNQETGKSELIKLNYNDYLWSEKVSPNPKQNPVLKPGDIIVVIEEERYSFRENVSFVLPIVTTIVSIATLIITITYNN